jgi:ligand-binding SRPBCC domain-containing protein
MLLHLSTLLPASPEVAFDASRNLRLHQTSMAHTGEILVAGPACDLAGPGDVMTWEARHFGIRQRLTTQITAYDRPHSFTDEMLQGAFRSMTHRHCFTTEGEGTRMEDFFDYTTPFGWAGQLFDVLVLRRYMRKLLEERNRAILRAVSPGAHE